MDKLQSSHSNEDDQPKSVDKLAFYEPNTKDTVEKEEPKEIEIDI